MDKELYVRQVFEINRLEQSADRIIEQVLDALRLEDQLERC